MTLRSLGYRVKFEQELQFRPPKEYFFDACQVLARHHTISPVAAYLHEIQKSWDGVLQALETWLIRTAGAEDTPYVRAISRLILLGGGQPRPGARAASLTRWWYLSHHARGPTSQLPSPLWR
jgi:predicted P-loop ATPase